MGATTSIGEHNETKNYELIEGGVYPARCLQVVELGTHDNTHPQAAPGSVKKELMIIWELSGELMQDGRPFTINKRYTNSLNEKAILRKDLEAWRGRKFTEDELKCFALAKILDAPCMINIVQTQGKKDPSKTYNNVMSIMPLPKGMTVERRVNELVDFGIDDRQNPELMDKLWPWVKAIVESSYEGSGKPLPGSDPAPKTPDTPANPDDDIPF